MISRVPYLHCIETTNESRICGLWQLGWNGVDYLGAVWIDGPVVHYRFRFRYHKDNLVWGSKDIKNGYAFKAELGDLPAVLRIARDFIDVMARGGDGFPAGAALDVARFEPETPADADVAIAWLQSKPGVHTMEANNN